MAAAPSNHRSNFCTLAALIGVGCVSYSTEAWDGPLILRSGSDVAVSNVLFAGSCSQRRQCSERSASLSAGQLNWACDGSGSCADDDLWVAAPRAGALGLAQTTLCGRSVRICAGAKCVNALIRDASMYQTKWEASQGVLTRIGISSGVRDGTCGAYGAGNLPVSLTVPTTPKPVAGECSAVVNTDGSFIDGYFCGGALISGNPNVLYECKSGVKSISETCINGCERRTDTEADECKP